MQKIYKKGTKLKVIECAAFNQEHIGKVGFLRYFNTKAKVYIVEFKRNILTRYDGSSYLSEPDFCSAKKVRKCQ